jgi:hypothetical protein
MSVSVDGFITDREGVFAWTSPSDELFGFHTALVSELGGYPAPALDAWARRGGVRRHRAA